MEGPRSARRGGEFRPGRAQPGTQTLARRGRCGGFSAPPWAGPGGPGGRSGTSARGASLGEKVLARFFEGIAPEFLPGAQENGLWVVAQKREQMHTTPLMQFHNDRALKGRHRHRGRVKAPAVSQAAGCAAKVRDHRVSDANPTAFDGGSERGPGPQPGVSLADGSIKGVHKNNSAGRAGFKDSERVAADARFRAKGSARRALLARL